MALGFLGCAASEVFPATSERRCWVHKTANVLAALSKRLQPATKGAIAVIYNAETRTEAIDVARPSVR